ncbi:hypothetical protein PG985_011503 [Apiospora marii]|uniref:uncharacterized protein n=1 Tax=Apiospora marii TaxID=335849 RepID=UPI0031327BED
MYTILFNRFVLPPNTSSTGNTTPPCTSVSFNTPYNRVRSPPSIAPVVSCWTPSRWPATRQDETGLDRWDKLVGERGVCGVGVGVMRPLLPEGPACWGLFFALVETLVSKISQVSGCVWTVVRFALPAPEPHTSQENPEYPEEEMCWNLALRSSMDHLPAGPPACGSSRASPAAA